MGKLPGPGSSSRSSISWAWSPVGMSMGTRNSMDFCSIRVRVWVNFKLVSLLMGTKSYSLGLWARVCSYPNPNPMGFLNPIQHKAIVILFNEFITNLISISFTSYFDESLMFCWWVGVLLLCSCGICICIWWICDFIWCCDHLNIELVIYIFISFCNF